MIECIDKVLQGAERLGALNPASIYALVAILLGWDKVRTAAQAKKTMDDWQKIRSDDAASDLILAQAVQKLADKVADISTVLHERLPGRGDK